MGAPTVDEVEIYDEPTKMLEQRVAVGVDYPAMTEAFSDDASADLDKRDYAYSYFGGPPLTAGGYHEINLYGAACREFFALRPHRAAPINLNTPFRQRFTVKFPAADCIYDAVVRVLTIDTHLGTAGDPFSIVQHGSMHFGDNLDGSGVGGIEYTFPGLYPGVVFENDQAAHTYEIDYDPSRDPPLIITVDEIEIYPVLEDPTDARPYAIVWGALQQDGEVTPAISTALLNGGTLEAPNPLPIIQVTDIETEADDYDVLEEPDWTSGTASDIDDALEAEIYPEGGASWAKIPNEQIVAARTQVGRAVSGGPDTFEVRLLGRTIANPLAADYHRQRWLGQPIVIDSRISSEDGTEDVLVAEWRRHICGVVESAEFEGAHFVLRGRDRPSFKLDTYFAVGYFAVALDEDTQDGPADGARQSLDIDVIFQDFLDVSDALVGDPLGATEGLFRLIDVTPQGLGNGGGALGVVMRELGQRAGQEMYRDYEVSGDAQYGRVRSNLWSMDQRQALAPMRDVDYAFNAQRVANRADVLSPGVRASEDLRAGAGQVYHRNDGGIGDYEPLDNAGQPVYGVFPSFAWPPNTRVLHDSGAAFVGSGPQTALVQVQDWDGVNVTGGLPMHRWRMENTQRRTISFATVGHNWPQPAQVVTVRDPQGSGISHVDGDAAANKWVIDNVELLLESGSLRTTLQLSTAYWLDAVRQARPDGTIDW